jgi:Leucine-rich repeat (LRR) protein
MTNAQMTNEPAAPKRRRFLPRFSLRTFVIVVALLGVGFGLAGNFWRRVQQQRAIVAQIEAAGGKVNYDYEFGMGEDLELYLEGGDRGVFRYGKTDDGRRMRRSIHPSGSEIEEIEMPPGPEWLRRLLGDDAFARITEVDLAWFRPEESEPLDTAILLKLRNLKVLRLSPPEIKDESLAIAARLPFLRALELRGKDGDVSVHGMAQLAKISSLQSLVLHGPWVNDEILVPVGELSRLKILTVASSEKVTSGMLAHISDDNRIRELSIVDCRSFDDRGTEHLERLKHLKELWLFRCPVSDDTLRHISGLHELEFLMLEGTEVSDPGMVHLTGLHKLKRLILARTKISDAGLESLRNLDKLESLMLGETKVTDDGLPVLAELTELKDLHLFPTEITDEGLVHLRSLQNLKRLSIGPHISVEAANELREAMPGCEIHRVREDGSFSFPDY